MDSLPNTIETPEVHVSLVAESSAIRAGSEVWLALRIQHQPHWHTYWLNAGDSGLNTKASFDLPAGVRLGAFQWPHPKRLPLGDLVNFGFEDLLYVPLRLSLERNFQGREIAIRSDVRWLACKEECIPGQGTIELRLPVADTGDVTEHASAITGALAKVPKLGDWTVAMREDGAEFEVSLSATTENPELVSATWEVFPSRPQVWRNQAPLVRRSGNELQFRVARSEYFSTMPKDFAVVLVDPNSGRSFQIPLGP